GEIELSLAFGVGIYFLGKDVVTVIAAELEPPSGNSMRGREGAFFEQLFQFLAFYFSATRVEPDFLPGVARDLDDPFDLHRLVVGVERLEVDRDLVLGSVEVVPGARVEGIALARDPRRAGSHDFPARTVGDARLDGILEILRNVARRVEGDRRPAGR